MYQHAQCNYCLSEEYRVVSEGIRDWEYGVEGRYSYLECASCHGIQIFPFPSLEDLKKAYDIDYHGYASSARRGPVFSLLYGVQKWLFQRKMRRLIDPSSRVLDVGCGQGDFLRSLKELGTAKLEGIDFSPDMIDALAAEGIPGYCGTFPDFPGMPDSYDMISMNNYLEHTLEPEKELDKAYDLLAPGGILVGEVPGFDSWERRLFGRFWGGNHVPRHTYQFSSAFLVRLLQGSGYDTIEIHHQLNTSHWALSVQNFMQRNKANLRGNPDLKHGRSWYYVPLLLAFIPINVICVLFHKCGCIRFSARKQSYRAGHA